MRILYFGNAQDAVGVEYEDVEVFDKISSFAALLAWIHHHRPAVGHMIAANAARVAVDERVVGDEDHFLQPHTIAIFPPLSGG